MAHHGSARVPALCMALVLCCGSPALAERAAETLDESVSLLQITRQVSQQLSQVNKVCPPMVMLTAPDVHSYDFFGQHTSMSADGARVAVAAAGDDVGGLNRGSVYVFDGVIGEELHKLTALDGGNYDGFGKSVSMSSDGTRLAVGASLDDDWTGSAYVFDIGTGEQLLKLMAADAAVHDRFGTSMSISSNGSYLAVGAIGGVRHLENPRPGSVYLFNASTRHQLLKVTAPDGPATDPDFGASESMSSDGARVAVGAPTSRAAYVFDARTGGQMVRLTTEDGNPDDHFGDPVAISADGSRVAVGAYYDNGMGPYSGAAWSMSLSSDGTLVAAGSFYYGEEMISADVFDVGAGTQLAKLTAPHGGAFGYGVSFGPDSRRLSVGAIFGASAFVLDLSSMTPAPTTVPTPAPTAPTIPPTPPPTTSSSAAPTGAPTAAVPTEEPTATPTIPPSPTPTASPSDAPTEAPTPAPAKGASATGDPHVTNVDGVRFDIMKTGVHEFLRLPRRASRHRGSAEPELLLTVLASVERADDDACLESYVRQLDMAGSWLNSSGSLRFRAEGGGLDAAQAIRLSVNGSLADAQALGRDRRVHPFLEVSEPKDPPADRVSTAIQKVPMLTVKLGFEAATLKIDWMHRMVPGGPVLNHLNFQAFGLRKFLGSASMDIGGILWRDDHGDAASLPAECKPLGADLRVSHRAPGEKVGMQVITAAL